MSNNSFYFSHDYNARNDQKILQLRAEFGFEGYGLFWAILETMAETDDGYIMAPLIGGLSVGLNVPFERINLIIEFCVNIGLFRKDKKGFFSERMKSHKETRKMLSDKGKEGATKRWKVKKNSPPITPAITVPFTDPNSDPYAKERKGKERKEEAVGTRTLFEVFRMNSHRDFTDRFLLSEIEKFRAKYQDAGPEKVPLILSWISYFKDSDKEPQLTPEEIRKEKLKRAL